MKAQWYTSVHIYSIIITSHNIIEYFHYTQTYTPPIYLTKLHISDTSNMNDFNRNQQFQLLIGIVCNWCFLLKSVATLVCGFDPTLS